jgi:hypothetical protein
MVDLGVIESAAEGIGTVFGTVIEGVVTAIIPVIEELIPAFIRSIEKAFVAVREGIRGKEADVITTFTILIIMLGCFVTARGILARGSMAGRAPSPVSVPVVGTLPV